MNGQKAGFTRRQGIGPVPSGEKTAIRRPGCGRPGLPGRIGVTGPELMKVEISLIPSAS